MTLSTFSVGWILEEIASQEGLNVVTEGIDDICYGFIITSDQSFNQVCVAHKGAYNFQIIDGDPIRLVRRSVNADLIIDDYINQADCIRRNGAPALQFTRADPASLPRQVEIQFINPAREYATTPQFARHTAAPTTNAQISISLQFVLSDQQARDIAFDLLYRIWAQQLQISFEHKNTSYEPGDVLQITGDQGVFTVLVQETEFTKQRTNLIKATVLLTAKGVTAAAGTADPYVIPNTDHDTAAWIAAA